LVNTPDGTQMAFIRTDCFIFFLPSFSKHLSKGLEETSSLLHFLNKSSNIFQRDTIWI